MNLNLSFGQRLTLLFLLFMLGAALTYAATQLIGAFSVESVAAGRIAVVLQDLLVFIIPALVVALLITRLPADFLRLRVFPSWRGLILSIVALALCFPVIELLDYWMKSLPWPESILRFEAAAEASTRLLTGGAATAGNIALSLMIMALMTGLAEELFFRGALQRLFETRPMNHHAAIWLTALIFSLLHAQPVGLVQRTLLGALFGYSVYRTGSLWTAVILHVINNSLALAFLYF